MWQRDTREQHPEDLKNNLGKYGPSAYIPRRKDLLRVRLPGPASRFTAVEDPDELVSHASPQPLSVGSPSGHIQVKVTDQAPGDIWATDEQATMQAALANH